MKEKRLSLRSMETGRRIAGRSEIPNLLGAGGYFSGIEGFPHYDSPICRISPKDKFDAIREVIERCSVFADFSDRESFIETVHHREELQSTGIGHGVAIAHGKYAGVDRVRVGLGICHIGLDFKAVDHLPVHLLFVVASHPDQQKEYLQTLSWLMRFLQNETLRQALVCPCISLTDPEGSCSFFVHHLRSHHFLQ